MADKQIQIEIAEKLIKIRILRDRTDNEGEKASANTRLQALLAKHDMTEADLDAVAPAVMAMLDGKPIEIMTPHGRAIRYPDGRIEIIRQQPVIQWQFVQVQGWGTGTANTSTASFW